MVTGLVVDGNGPEALDGASGAGPHRLLVLGWRVAGWGWSRPGADCSQSDAKAVAAHKLVESGVGGGASAARGHGLRSKRPKA